MDSTRSKDHPRDDFRPRFGVDVEVLLPDGEPDPALPILTGLPLPAPMGGQEAGMFGFPEEGTTVVVSFAYGLPHKPFITQILPTAGACPGGRRTIRYGSTARRASSVSTPTATGCAKRTARSRTRRLSGKWRRCRTLRASRATPGGWTSIQPSQWVGSRRSRRWAR